MDDHHSGVALDVTNFEDDGSRVRAEHLREPVTEFPHSDGVAVGVKDVLLAQTVLESRRCNDRILTHHSKVTCEPFHKQGPAWLRTPILLCRDPGRVQATRIRGAETQVQLSTKALNPDFGISGCEERPMANDGGSVGCRPSIGCHGKLC